MKFYTNVSRWGSHILYRGYDNGKRVTERVKFKPTMYLPSKHEKTIWTALDGTPVEPMKFDSMKDAKEFMAPYENIESFKIYGNTRYVAQFIQERFPDEIHFDRNVINVSTLDIEVMSNDGFPKPEDALHEIITITVKNSIDDVYYVWGTKPYDADKKLIHSQVEYRQFVDERSMMLDFVTWFAMPKNSPDIITGWNSRGFDIPYIVNRIIAICGQETVNLLSPFGKVEPKETVIKGRPMKIYEITGIAQLDYMDLFKKFTTHTYGNQESYKLGHIAHVVLGDGKLSYEEYGSLHNLYEENYQTFVDYNIKDVEIVDRLEDKLGLITLVLTLAYIGGVNYNDTLGTTAIWDSIIYRDLARKAIAIPPSVENFKGDYPGGYVKEPKVGLHNWVCSFDLNSLYPNLIIQYNMSPETITSQTTPGISPDVILNDVPFEPHMPGTIMAANGVHFRTDKIGVIPRIITEIYDKRVILKKAMLQEKKRLETIDKGNKVEYFKCEREISRLENQQIAVKILLNSLYGALGNQYFRYFDMRIAEATTLSGQLAIRWAEKEVNQFLNKTLKSKDKDYVIAIDTDSLYVSMDPIVQNFGPKNPVKFLDEFCAKAVEPMLTASYDLLSKKMFCPTNRMGMKREAIADRGIWTAKKRYILNVHNNEGVQYAKPKIKIMGIEAVKSSTPAVCRDALKKMFEVIMTKSEVEAQREIVKIRENFISLPPEEIAFPRGASDVSGYSNKKEGGIYKKGTPIHVRGCLLFNDQVVKCNLQKKHQLIRSGDKIKFIYLKTPNPMQENVISFVDGLPKELGLHRYIDHELQFEKTFLDPLSIIFDSIGWTMEKTSNLEEFFA